MTTIIDRDAQRVLTLWKRFGQISLEAIHNAEDVQTALRFCPRARAILRDWNNYGGANVTPERMADALNLRRATRYSRHLWRSRPPLPHTAWLTLANEQRRAGYRDSARSALAYARDNRLIDST